MYIKGQVVGPFRLDRKIGEGGIGEVWKARPTEGNNEAVALKIAQKISGDSADVQQLLAQLNQEPVQIEIIKAEYGANSTYRDVTDILRKHVRDFPLIVLPSANYNASFGGDPLPSVRKQLKIRYRLNGKEGEAVFAENATIMLPIPK